MIRSNSKVFIENGIVKKIGEFIEDKEGKIIYEVLRIIEGKPLFLEDHYKRMKNSYKLSGVELKETYDELKKQILTLVKESKVKEGNIKITYSVENKRLKIFFIDHKYPTEEMYKNGVDTILYFGERENPNAKVVNKSFRDMVNEKIAEREVFEAILINRNGIVTEGSKSNIFMIKDDALYTSKVEAVLPGVTRTEIIELAEELNIQVNEVDYNYLGLKDVDAMFISGTSPKILPIKKIEEEIIDVDNKVLRKLMRAFNEKINDYILNFN